MDNGHSIAISTRDLRKRFGNGTGVEALRGVDFEARLGELTFIVGPSGCGKTTLLSVITGLLDATAGNVELFGRHPEQLPARERILFRRENVGFVFQQYNLLPALTAAENAAVPLIAAGMKHGEAVKRAESLLDQLGLSERRTALPRTLSGGEQQRVAIARALVHGPRLVVCDEPTAALDGATGEAVMKLIAANAVQPDRAAVVVTHDARVFHYADVIAHMDDGRIVKTEKERPSERPSGGVIMNRMNRFFLPLFALAALTFGIISIVLSQPKREQTSPPSPPPESSFEHNVAAVGLIEASTENIAIGSNLSGVVEKVFVTVGDSVKAGDPLFELDTRHLRAQLDQAEAARQAAQARVTVAGAELDDSRHQFKFAEGLSDSRAISKEEVTRRRSAVQTAEAKLAEAKAEVLTAAAQVEMIKTDLDRSVVTAPTDGEALQVKLRAGEYAVAGATSSPMILLGRPKPLHLRVDVDEHEAWRVRPEAKAVAAVRGNAELKAPLTFVRFEPFVLPKKSLTGDSTERVDTRVLQVIYRIDRDDLPLFIGQQMDVFIDAPGDDKVGKL